MQPEVKNCVNFGIRYAWIEIPALSLTSCATSGSNFSNNKTNNNYIKE